MELLLIHSLNNSFIHSYLLILFQMKAKYYFIMLLRVPIAIGTKQCLILMLWIASFLAMTPVHAQGLNESPAGVMIDHKHPKGGWMFSYTYMNMMMQDNLSGTAKLSDDDLFRQNYAMSPQNMRMDMHMLMAMYGVSGKFSLMAMANYNVMTMTMNPLVQNMIMNGSEMTMSTQQPMTIRSSGIGDVRVWGVYGLLNGEGSSLTLSAGVNIPTGSTTIMGGNDYNNQRLPYMMQLGSGSFDLLPGITYYKKAGSITWSAQVLSALRPFNNAQGYHYGNELTVNGWAAYHIWPSASVSLRAEGYTSDIIKAIDPMITNSNNILDEPDFNPNNYGGQRVSGYGGLNYYIHRSNLWPDSKLCLEYGLPLYQNLNGPQLATQSTLYATVLVSF
jgi:hypothetical protein